MPKRRGGSNGREDQFGEFGSQDRDQGRSGFGGGHKSGGGGGTAGSRTGHKAGHDLAFQKHVPKFLQQYQHLLGSKQQVGDGDDDEEAVAAATAAKRPGNFEGWSDDEEGGAGGKKGGKDDFDDVEADALRRAIEENPELAKEFEGKLQQKLNQAMAVEEKDKGNKFFTAKKYKEAIECFTKSIELDPQNEVYYSNRSAAHAALDDWEAAAKDAKMAVQIKPKWAKAHSRLAVAFYGLKLYSDAVESYKRALTIEPDDQALQKGLERAMMMELQQSRDKKHTFFNKKQKLDLGSGARPEQGGRKHDDGTSKTEKGRKEEKKASALSFADEDN